LITLKGEKIYLRALEPEDLDFVFSVENNETIWEVSNTQTPYSRYLIKQYLENAHEDIYQAKQLRLAICINKTLKPIGLVDLFDFDPKNNRAGIGIVINENENRNQGVGQEALSLLINYSFTKLNLHQLFANIGINNVASLNLFAKFGFVKVGTKKDWTYHNGKYFDEEMFQLINTNF
jgi:diamine N-acetyltransferase